MRLRVGVCMPSKGGRTAVIALEVRERWVDKRRVFHYIVGAVDRVTPFTVEAARDRVAEMVTAVQDLRPCVMVDTGSPQGVALRQQLVVACPKSLHKPHAYPGTGDRNPLFAAFLQAYSAGCVTFEANLAYRADLDRALVFYLGQGVRKEGVELSSEDEALVIALGLAMYWPRHGSIAAPAQAANESTAV